MSPILLVSLLVMLAIFAAMVGFYRWLSWAREAERRLIDSTEPVGAEVKGRRALTDQANQQLRKLTFAQRIERQLVAANSNLTVAEFLMTRVGLALGLLVVGWFISGTWLGGVPLAIIGWMAPAINMRYQKGKRISLFASQLPDMLEMLTGSLRAGYGLLHAITVVENEMPEPISTEFGRVVKETALGYSIGDALDHLVDRIDNENLTLIVTAIHVQNEVGGSLADVLETISKTIRERIQLQGEIRAMTAQQRITGWMLSALPFLVASGMMVLNPDYLMEVLKPGWPMLIPITAGVMVVFGNIVMRMVTRIDV